jgi:diguanylate cyclase (GGDEF)-like protein
MSHQRLDSLMQTKSGKLGIGNKIAKLVAIAIFVAMMIVAAILSVMQVQQTVATKRLDLEGTAYVFASAIADHVEVKDRAAIQSVLRSVARVPSILHASALDRNHELIAHMGSVSFLASDMIDSNASIVAMLSKGLLPVEVDIRRGGQVVGSLVLIANISDVRGILYRNLLTTILAALAAACLAVPLSRPLQRKITTPLVTLTSAMAKVRDTRSFQPAQIEGAEGEIKQLVESFNGMIDDIHTRDQAMQKLAYYDPLTGLPNRVHFQKIVDEHFADINPEKSALLFIADIDNFHAINDALGHSIGDALIMTVAALFKDEVGERGKVARLGGDEFVVYIPGVATISEGETEIARFIATLYQPIKLLGQELHITTAIGAVILPLHAKSSGEAQRNLNLAAHEAKHLGPSRVSFFQQALADNIKDEAELANGLRIALIKKELEVFYQPIVDLKSKKVAGFEALCRWKHPVKGYIPPFKFIPVAEKSGLISELGDWILHASCVQAKAWLDAGHLNRTVSVNVSAAQILQVGFIEKVQATLQKTGLPPHLLCLELTESLFVGKSMHIVTNMLAALKELGVLTALDDFGTGYSSLSYLESLPFDKLKIDRAFVSAMNSGQKNIDLVKGIINLAHALGISVVAEGAETATELALLRSLNADTVQGYVYAKPTPAAEALAIANAIDAQTQKLETSA